MSIYTKMINALSGVDITTLLQEMKSLQPYML